MEGFKTFKPCSKCGMVKRLSEFYSGTMICKKCKIEYTKNYQIENKIIIANKKHDIYIKNKTLIRTKAKAYVFNKGNKDRVELTDSYVSSVICGRSKLTSNDLTKEIIAIKRKQIMTHRLVAKTRRDGGDISKLDSLKCTYLALINVLIHDIEKDIETKRTKAA